MGDKPLLLLLLQSLLLLVLLVQGALATGRLDRVGGSSSAAAAAAAAAAQPAQQKGDSGGGGGGGSSEPSPTAAAETGRFVPGQWIVSLRDDCAAKDVVGSGGGAAAAPARAAAPQLAASTRARFANVATPRVFHHAVQGFVLTAAPDSKDEAAAVAGLMADPCVRAVSRDRIVKVLQTGGGGSPGVVGGQTVPTGVRRVKAPLAPSKASGVAVAVIDTGISAAHPDLAGLVKGGVNCVTPDGSWADDNGHGTHVSGTIAALDNALGVVGVAAGTDLYAVKVLDAGGSGSDSSILCGLNWVMQQNAAMPAGQKKIRVVNLSLGGGAEPYARVPLSEECKSRIPYSATHEAFCRFARDRANGGTVVAAAGNEAADLDGSFPAVYPEVLTVTALADYDGAAGGDAPAGFSNYVNAEKRDAGLHTVAAPGYAINSTKLDGGYVSYSGTSMAAPHVAAMIALCFGVAGQGDGPCATAFAADAYSGALNVIRKVVRDDAAYRQTGADGFAGERAACGAGCTRHYGNLIKVVA